MEVVLGIDLKLELFEEVISIEKVDSYTDNTGDDDQTLDLRFEVLHFEEKGGRRDESNEIVDESRVDELSYDIFGDERNNSPCFAQSFL